MWPLQIRRIRQGQGDLGDRMARVLQGHRPGPVCVIGADIPGINRADIAQAFKVLGPCEAVFGPAADGGYWLVGLKNARPAPVTMFEQVRWSTQYALADSVASVRGLRIAYLSEKHDVDTLHDLRMTTDSTRAT